MPSAPNTVGVMTAIKTICAGLQVNGSAAFTPGSVQIGRYKDLTDIVPVLEISGEADETQRFAIGGKIDDSQVYLLEVVAGLIDANGVEILLANIRDSLTAAFHATALLTLAGQVAYAGLVPQSGKRGYLFRNGQWWRCYSIKLRVRYEYSVIITP